MKRITAGIFIFTMLFTASCAHAFTDVNEEDWFFENVTEMTQKGYLTGYDDGSFRPSGIITNAELVSILARITGITPKTAQASHWAAPVLQSALDAGWYDWDEIPPTGEKYDGPIERMLAVKIVMKAMLPDMRGDYNEASKAPDFSALDGRYYDSVIAAVSNGIIYGDEKGNLNPKSYITRAEACAVIMRAANKSGGQSADLPPTETAAPVFAEHRSGGVSSNGQLRVEGTRLLNERGEAVILKGMSTHGLQWYGQFAAEEAIKATADYGANLFRCAMYTGEGGYLSNPQIKNTLINAVDAAIRQDMYVIIDWHILSDGDPMASADKAAEFFDEMSARYAESPAVLYEICNEPNGNITWSHNVKPYAERIIQVIRAHSSGIILVGSPTWSQDLHEAAKSPIDAENIMYTCHFYAGTHTDWLRSRIVECGLPVFISEWGTSAADGSGGVYTDEAIKWRSFMDEHGISRANWSLCDKNETSAALIPGADVSDGISYDELSESGKFVFDGF